MNFVFLDLFLPSIFNLKPNFVPAIPVPILQISLGQLSQWRRWVCRCFRNSFSNRVWSSSDLRCPRRSIWSLPIGLIWCWSLESGWFESFPPRPIVSKLSFFLKGNLILYVLRTKSITDKYQITLSLEFTLNLLTESYVELDKICQNLIL